VRIHPDDLLHMHKTEVARWERHYEHLVAARLRARPWWKRLLHR
jgi:hypothetical protein